MCFNMVGISYTGVDGNTTKFRSDSASSAMTRLRSIKGYNGTLMDSAAAGLSGAFAARHKNARRVSGISGHDRSIFNGVGQNAIYSGNGGKVVKLPSLSGLQFENGRLVGTTQDKFVSDRGSVVATGNRHQVTIANSIPSNDSVISKATTIAKDEANKAVSELKNGLGVNQQEIEVVSNIKFDSSSGPLKIIVEKTKIKVGGIGDRSTENYSIGTEVMVHESMSVDRHSYVWVLSRRSNVSSQEAKTKH